jgi:hypothetical protein
VSNTGSGEAADLSLLVTLPPVVDYLSTTTPFGGNASEGSLITPNPDSLEVFYSGFTVPAASGSGPGYLDISFKAMVVSAPVGGTYPITVQVIDGSGDTVQVDGLAPLTITGASSTPLPQITAGPK